MSIVSVHGPQTFGASGAGGAGSGQVVTAPQVKATADMANGQKFTFDATDKTRVAADYDWAFPGGTPATATDNKGPIVVTYATAGVKTATLTVAAGAGPPAGGAYPINVTAAATSGPRAVEEGGGEEPQAEAYDPGEYNISEVQEHVNTLETAEEVQAILDAELAGKNRSTLVAYLESLLPYDPSAHTVQEVVDHAEANPEDLADIIAAEQADKNRSTLLSQLEALQTT